LLKFIAEKRTTPAKGEEDEVEDEVEGGEEGEEAKDEL
jgi:hypothetical protein